MTEIIDFLQYVFGINESASILVLMLLATGLVGSFAASRLLVFGTVHDKTDIFTIVVLVITILLGAASGIPMLILLVTFKLKYMVVALLIVAVPVLPFFWLVYSITFGTRMAKYMRNPVTKEVLAFARQHDVAGIQCFVDGVRFYSVLENESYCKSENKTVTRYNQAAFSAAQSNPPRPTGYEDYAKSANSLGILRFSDRGYPNLPDVAFFGKVLAKKLKGYQYACHSVSLNYDETSSVKTVRHICHVHEDCFVYKKSAMRALRAAGNRARRAAAAGEKKQKNQTNQWE